MLPSIAASATRSSSKSSSSLSGSSDPGNDSSFLGSRLLTFRSAGSSTFVSSTLIAGYGSSSVLIDSWDVQWDNISSSRSYWKPLIIGRSEKNIVELLVWQMTKDGKISNQMCLPAKFRNAAGGKDDWSFLATKRMSHTVMCFVSLSMGVRLCNPDERRGVLARSDVIYERYYRAECLGIKKNKRQKQIN